MTEKKIIPQIKHEVIPLHEKLSDEEKQKLFSQNTISFRELPKIKISDAAIAHDPAIKPGDVIKVTRKSSTAKEVTFYRGVTDA